MQPITPSDRLLFERYLTLEPERTVEYCFASLYAWSHKSFDRYAVWRDWLLLSIKDPLAETWLMPYGPPDARDAVMSCKATHDAANPDIPFRMTQLTERSKARLTEWFGDHFHFCKLHGASDYLYKTDDLVHLAGKKFHGKRNFVNRFRAAYAGRYSHEPITLELLDEVWAFERQWARHNNLIANISLRDEAVTLRLLLMNMDALGATGRLLRVDGTIVAFTIGAPCGLDTTDIICEKADYSIAGAYQMINQLYAEHDCATRPYINREEDMGLEGLRKAKQSYNPVELLTKYEAVWRD